MVFTMIFSANSRKFATIDFQTEESWNCHVSTYV